MKGSTYRRCSCRDPKTGKELGTSCPKRNSRNHCTYSIRQELPSREDGSRRSFAHGGYSNLKAAQADLDHVRALLGLADSDDPEGTGLIAEMLAEVSRERSPLPEVEETRRRLNAGQDLIGSLTVAEWLDRWLAGKRIRKSGLNRYETDIRVHLKPHIGGRRLDRLRVSHLSEMFTDIRDANAQILGDNAQRRAAIDEMATVPWKGVENRARRKAMQAAIDKMPPFRRITGPATRQHVKATLRASLNDAIGQQIITFNPAAHVEIDPVRKPKALVWTDERVTKCEQTGEKPSPVMVWTPQQTGAFLDFVAEDRLYAMWHLIAFRDLRHGAATLMLAAGIDIKIVSDTSATATPGSHGTSTRASCLTSAGAPPRLPRSSSPYSARPRPRRPRSRPRRRRRPKRLRPRTPAGPGAASRATRRKPSPRRP